MSMPNAADILKIMAAKKQFETAHPKFYAFVKTVIGKKIEEGTVIEISIKNPDGTENVGNMRVSAEDLELFDGLKGLISQ